MSPAGGRMARVARAALAKYQAAHRMKEFRGYLAKQPEEFRGYLAKQQEEFRGYLAKQQKEFRGYLANQTKLEWGTTERGFYIEQRLGHRFSFLPKFNTQHLKLWPPSLTVENTEASFRLRFSPEWEWLRAILRLLVVFILAVLNKSVRAAIVVPYGGGGRETAGGDGKKAGGDCEGKEAGGDGERKETGGDGEGKEAGSEGKDAQSTKMFWMITGLPVALSLGLAHPPSPENGCYWQLMATNGVQTPYQEFSLRHGIVFDLPMTAVTDLGVTAHSFASVASRTRFIGDRVSGVSTSFGVGLGLLYDASPFTAEVNAYYTLKPFEDSPARLGVQFRFS